MPSEPKRALNCEEKTHLFKKSEQIHPDRQTQNAQATKHKTTPFIRVRGTMYVPMGCQMELFMTNVGRIMPNMI